MDRIKTVPYQQARFRRLPPFGKGVCSDAVNCECPLAPGTSAHLPVAVRSRCGALSTSPTRDHRGRPARSAARPAVEPRLIRDPSYRGVAARKTGSGIAACPPFDWGTMLGLRSRGQGDHRSILTSPCSRSSEGQGYLLLAWRGRFAPMSATADKRW